jgi:hypothetical protein
LEGSKVVVGRVVVDVEVVAAFGLVTVVSGTVVRADVGGRCVADVVGALPVRASTNTPTTTARIMTKAALRG